MEPSIKRGRPPKLGETMTGKTRAAVFRSKLWDTASLVHENAGTAKTSVLMAGLNYQIKRIGEGADAAEVAREFAAIIIRELCDRNGIILT